MADHPNPHLARISHKHSSRFGQTVLPDDQSGRTVYEKCGLVEAGDSLQLIIREQSSLSYTLQEGSTLELIHTGSADIKVTLHARSHLKTFYVGTEGERRECRYHITLAGEEARASLLGLSMVKGTQAAHIHVEVIHQKPHTYSEQCFKSVVADSGRVEFTGLIHLCPEAQKSSAEQKSKSLLLSDKARVHTKPQLQIYADDVKATHGATVGHLDETELFYLQSRGFSLEEARKLLVHAFIKELIEKIPVSSIQQESYAITY
ncbi:MAG: FeS cluster assembly protein SufD [Chlamydiae bacterium]|nr:FeS cluster assembly protein SufD [Chlamydiota bacterium]